MLFTALMLFLLAGGILLFALTGDHKTHPGDGEDPQVIPVSKEHEQCPLKLPHEPHEWAKPRDCAGVPEHVLESREAGEP